MGASTLYTVTYYTKKIETVEVPGITIEDAYRNALLIKEVDEIIDVKLYEPEDVKRDVYE